MLSGGAAASSKERKRTAVSAIDKGRHVFSHGTHTKLKGWIEEQKRTP